MKNYDQILGTNIKGLRNKLSVSQEELARELGLHQTAICRVENGKQGLTVTQLVVAARFFKRDVSWMLVDRGDKWGVVDQGGERAQNTFAIAGDVGCLREGAQRNVSNAVSSSRRHA